MGLEWFAQRIDDREWYVFVHRRASVAAYPIKPVIGAAVGEIPPGGSVASPACPRRTTRTRPVFRGDRSERRPGGRGARSSQAEAGATLPG
jgi:hypothetical protein